MDRVMLENRLKKKEADGVFRKDESAKALAPQYMEKARHNLVSMQASYRLSAAPEVKSAALLPKDFNEFDWTVIKAYYAMYHSVLACLAKTGYKSDDHNASVLGYLPLGLFGDSFWFFPAGKLPAKTIRNFQIRRRFQKLPTKFQAATKFPLANSLNIPLPIILPLLLLI